VELTKLKGAFMRINIKQFNQYSNHLSEYIEKRVRFALGRFVQVLREVKISLRDLNGPKGGIDKSCKFIILLKDRVLVLESVEEDFYRAVDRGVERVRNVISREMRKRVSLRHKTITI